MTALTGTITDDPSNTANQLFADFLNTSLLAEGWTSLRAVAPPGGDREYILNSDGISGSEDLYIGIRSYQDINADYYNLSFAIFNGYVPTDDFDQQPGYRESGCPADNLSITYWVMINKNRLLFGIKIGTPVYETVYVGRFLPYASPSQYPYPMALFGPFEGQLAIRYSEPHEWSFGGEVPGGVIRPINLVDISPRVWPFSARIVGNRPTAPPPAGEGAYQRNLRELEGSYALLPLQMADADNVYGFLDGLYYISGFNNDVENTLTINTVDYIVFQNVNLTGFQDYLALELQ